jgi:hypothetical protein
MTTVPVLIAAQQCSQHMCTNQSDIMQTQKMNILQYAAATYPLHQELQKSLLFNIVGTVKVA